MLKEKWKPISGYESGYLISSFGRVLSLRFKRFLLINPEKDIYPAAHLSIKNRAKSVRLHKLVANHFIDNPLKKTCINHIDGNKKNNRADNLEWVTYSENSRHSINFLKRWPDASRPVAMLDDHGNTIKSFISCKDARHYLGTTSNVTNAIKRNIRLCGYYFKYLDR